MYGIGYDPLTKGTKNDIKCTAFVMIHSKRALFEERYPMYGIGYDPLTKVNKERFIQYTGLVMIHLQRSTKSDISNVRHWL